jgi:hypothetical protein
MNRDWPAYGGLKQIRDKRPSVLMGAVLAKEGYQSGTCITPPKNNAKQFDPRWKEENVATRKIIESTSSVLAGSGLRGGQVKTMLSLRLKVASLVLPIISNSEI